MERHGKILLLSLILLIAGAFVVVHAYAQDIVVCYPIGLALALLGSIFWLNAE